MSKIIVEDLTNSPKAEAPFDETLVEDFASQMMQAIVHTGISLGLYPKEIVYSIFLIGENMKSYAIMTSNGSEEEYDEVDEWAKKKSVEWTKKVQESGIVEKVKDLVNGLKKPSSGGESQ